MALMYIICWEQHFNQHKELSLFFIIKCTFQLSWLYFILSHQADYSDDNNIFTKKQQQQQSFA